MEKNKQLLTEGGRITGTLSYKDFINANPEWKVELIDDKLHSTGSGKVKVISPYLKGHPEISGEAWQRAMLTIREIEEAMLDHKPNELKQVIDNYIWWDIDSYFGDATNELTPYEAIQAEVAYVKKHHSWGNIAGINESRRKNELLTKQHQAAYAEATVRKYFEERLKDAKDRRTGLKRALNDLSPQEKADAKAWFGEHVTDIYFIIPEVDDPDKVVFYNKDGSEDTTKTDAVIEKLKSLTKLFVNTYPTAEHGVDFTYRKTSGKPDPRQTRQSNKVKKLKTDDKYKDLWNWIALVTFDTIVDAVPENIKNIINNAKRQALQDTKTMQEMSDDHTVCSVPLAQTILSFFNNDFTFFKKNKPTIADGSDELINDYELKYQ